MKITKLHIEASSYCNARCPGCPRNYDGFPLPRNVYYKEEHLDVNVYKDILSKYPDVNDILFCGNHGDPMMNPEIAELCRIFKFDRHTDRISIATNGSIGLVSDYKKMAELGVQITFGIDGLEDTNHLYRQDVNWNNLMERVKTFIDAGGSAEWQFIKFKHNMHQVDEAKKYAKELGFAKFFERDDGRNFFPARDTKGNVTHWVLPPDEDTAPVDRYYKTVTQEALDIRYSGTLEYGEKTKFGTETNRIFDFKQMHCEVLDLGLAYVDSSGQVLTCCFHGFGYENRPKILLKDLDILQKDWYTKDCNSVCATHCGDRREYDKFNVELI